MECDEGGSELNHLSAPPGPPAPAAAAASPRPPSPGAFPGRRGRRSPPGRATQQCPGTPRNQPSSTSQN